MLFTNRVRLFRLLLLSVFMALLCGAPALAQVGTWQAASDMSTGRYSPTATTLPDGRVLVAGGYDGLSTVESAEIYDPATGTFTHTGPLLFGRNFATATLLNDGMVLVAGG